MGEPVGDLAYPSNGTLLRLPEALEPSQPVFALHQKHAWAGSGIIVRLYNAMSSTQDTCIASGLLHIASAQLCDLMENPVQPLHVSDGKVTITLPPRQVQTVLLSVNPAGA